MALLNIFDIAGSALTAQSKRLNVAASNLANADSVPDRTVNLIALNKSFSGGCCTRPGDGRRKSGWRC
jgi:flagellar basal body rod protein FlgC